MHLMLDYYAWSTLVFLALAPTGSWSNEDPEINMNAWELITSKGYPCEQYTVITDDGYKIIIQRIPHGRHENYSDEVSPDGSKRPVMFVQHGLLGSSADWLVNLANESFPFVLAEAGFDVWLGNVRGNTYARSHTRLNPSSGKFWDFTWDDIANHDLPAMIKTALEISGQETLDYVGYSQGSLIGFAKYSTDTELARKIDHFYAVGPVATVGHINGAFRLMAPFLTPTKLTLKFFGIHEFLPSNYMTKLMARYLCGWTYTEAVCENFMFLIAGLETSGFNQSRVPVYISHTPAGTSLKNMVHFGQMVMSNKFQKFNYGALWNLKHYGSVRPPTYDVKNMKVPITLFIGDNDWLADTRDFNQSLRHKLPRIEQIHEIKSFNHLDFLWGLKANAKIYSVIIKHAKARYQMKQMKNKV